MKPLLFPRHLARLSSLLLLAPPLGLAATHTVTTADNASGPADGQTSLLEALTLAQNNDTIAFAIPGAGPHYIKTPETGYPPIEKSRLVIDGYTQPGAQPNSASLHENNNAALKIVIDSRDGGRYSLADYGDNGFGDTESAIFPLLFSQGTVIRGLAFIGITGGDSPADPYIYNIALIGASTDVKVQGCWFGLDPAAAPFPADNSGFIPGVHGARAAVASFRWDSETSASGLVIGTDGDGQNDQGEFNIMTGNLLAIHLQTPDVRISGNRINYLPDGRRWDNAITQQHSTEVEAFENGGGDRNIIGTDGNGISDENEGNYFGPVTYDTFLEFWRPAMDVVIAGNYFGVSPAGDATYAPPPGTSLVAVRSDSSYRIGSNFDEKSDSLEANHAANFGSPAIRFNNVNAPVSCRISFRGNSMRNMFGDLPIHSRKREILPDEDPLTQEFLNAYSHLLEDTVLDFRPAIASDSTAALIKGNIPKPYDMNGLITHADFYLADPEALALADEANPDGFPQGLTYLASRRVDGPDDTDAAPHAFAFANVPGVTAENLGRVICTAHYSMPGDGGFESTSIFSFPPQVTGAPAGGLVLSISADAATGASILSWTGGEGGFSIEHSTTLLDGSWRELLFTTQRSAVIPRDGAVHYYRIKSGIGIARMAR